MMRKMGIPVKLDVYNLLSLYFFYSVIGLFTYLLFINFVDYETNLETKQCFFAHFQNLKLIVKKITHPMSVTYV